MSEQNKIKLILDNLPKSSGIYQFFNKYGKIIYIGKSVNLKSRVNSYFNGKSKLNFAKQKMVNQIDDIKTILTNNETESLILETTLIKKYEPKYNILMKDGKNHIYIKITKEIIPQILKTRFKKNDSAMYFGPYTSTNYVNNILKLIKKVFGYRSCNLIFDKKDKFSGLEESNIQISNIGNTKIPCMDYYIKRCSGPCLKHPSKIKAYRETINKISDFLKGNTSKIKQDLIKDMKTKAGELKFEEAQKLKENLESIQLLEQSQIVRDGVDGDYNIINYIEKYDRFFIGMIEIKDSKITGFHNYEIKNSLEETSKEILKSFIEKIYSNEDNSSINYLIPFEIDFGNIDIKIKSPKIGTKNDLLTLCYKNIYEYAYKAHIDSLSTKGFSKKTMLNILETLGYQKINKDLVFECNDISHISGNHTVASRSIIENGKSNNSKYKKFRIKTLEEQKIDDFDSMREIMRRRIKEIQKTEYIPDLIIIDGGKGQLSSVVEIVEELKDEVNLLSSLQLVGIAKKEEELFVKKGNDFEKIVLGKNTSELRLIQKIRDEAHRFAITFNRDSRIKSMKKNILDELPGFGPKTRSKILKKYGNVEKLKEANIQELKLILNKNQIETLENHSII